MKVAFIGAGTMAEALIKGIIKRKIFNKEDIWASDILPYRLDYLHHEYGITCAVDNPQSANKADFVVLAVKPQSFKSVADNLAPYLEDKQSVVSIMAGVNMAVIIRSLKHENVIRVMPNMPA